MQRLLLLGVMFVSAIGLQAETGLNELKQENATPTDKENTLDIPFDAVIANEAIEAEKEEHVVNEIEETENFDIDTLILEAENALKEESIEEAASVSSTGERILIHYDEDDEAYIAVKKREGSKENIASKETNPIQKKEELSESIAQAETTEKRVFIQHDAESGLVVESKTPSEIAKEADKSTDLSESIAQAETTEKRVFIQHDAESGLVIESKSSSEIAKADEPIDPEASTFGFKEVPMESITQNELPSQKPFIEIKLDEPFLDERGADLSSIEAHSIASSSYELNKNGQELLDLQDPISTRIASEQKELEEIPLTIQEEPSIPFNQTTLEKNQSTYSSPRHQITGADLEKRPSISSFGNPQNSQETKPSSVALAKNEKTKINIQEVFSGSPIVYMLLLLLSMATITLFLYNCFYLRISELVPKNKLLELRKKIQEQQYFEAKAFCLHQESFFFKMLASGLSVKEESLSEIIETMKNEGKKHTSSFWQKLGLLNDIAIIAPMVGLLGTVLGMFYAFYDIQQVGKNVTSLFDGLGVSVGTTVAGLGVAILAMIMHSLSKYRLMKLLVHAENQSEQLAHLIKASTLQNPSTTGSDNEFNS